MDCKTCFNSRTGISENGYHTICTLSAWKSAECITQDYKHYMKSPFDITQKPVTNADRIRAMSDEELANKLYLGVCVRHFDDSHECKDNGCRKCWLDWLRQEAE